MFDSSRAIGRWRDILVSLGVDEKFLTNKHGPCPVCNGVDRYRFDDKGGRGTFYCSNCGPGDGVSLLMRIRNCDFKEAAKAVEEVLPSARVVEQREKADPRNRLKNVWKRAKVIQVGDDVYRYLNTRRVLSAHLPNDVLTATDEYFDEGKSCGVFSVMAAMIRDKAGKPKSLHVTYLRDGEKALVKSPKKVLSEIGQGASIRLYQPTHELCLAEGIETSLAVRKISGKPVWSLISAVNFKGFECPDGVRRIEIWADHDKNCAGQAAAYALANRLSTSGIDVDVFIPAKKGADWADEV